MPARSLGDPGAIPALLPCRPRSPGLRAFLVILAILGLRPEDRIQLLSPRAMLVKKSRRVLHTPSVTPAKAGVQLATYRMLPKSWIPACAGMTIEELFGRADRFSRIFHRRFARE